MHQPHLNDPRPRARMTPHPGHAGLLRVLVVVVLAASVIGGCSTLKGTIGPTAIPTTSTAPTPSEPTATLTPVPTNPGSTTEPAPSGQTDTDWGRIWDGLPTGFPAFPGAHATEIGAGPASATLDAGSTEPAAVMNFYQTALQAAGWIIVGVSGPREDGSLELSVVDIHPACQLRATVTPLGGSTIVTILYGAGCPFTS